LSLSSLLLGASIVEAREVIWKLKLGGIPVSISISSDGSYKLPDPDAIFIESLAYEKLKSWEKRILWWLPAWIAWRKG